MDNIDNIKITLDPWQIEVLNTYGNIVLRSGRQVGKSTIIGIKAAIYSLNNPNKLVMVISKTEKQAHLLFSKILNALININKTQIKKGKDRPTKTKISIKNGTIIHCLCVGDTGYGIMGYTIDLLIADEAAFIPEEVWNSIIPALAITRGCIWLLSTPFIKEGYYYDCFDDPSFTSFHQSSEDCPRRDQSFLDHKKKTLSNARYAQMYLGEFRDELRRYFPEDLIKQICILKRSDHILTSTSSRDFFLGCDIAGLGEDDTTYEIFDGTNPKNIVHKDNIIQKKQRTTETVRRILELDRKYDFPRKSIGIDDGGMGVGVFDQLLINDQTKRKVIALNNASRAIDSEDRQKKLLKEDMYDNLLGLMERQEIKLLDDPEVKDSLYSIQCENLKSGKTRIYGEDAHIVEGIIRAVYCIKTKGLNLYIY